MAAPGQWRRRVLEATLTHKKIAVAVPRGRNDDGDHRNMTGVDGRTQGVNRVANSESLFGRVHATWPDVRDKASELGSFPVYS